MADALLIIVIMAVAVDHLRVSATLRRVERDLRELKALKNLKETL